MTKKRLVYYIHHESSCAFVGEEGEEGDGLLIEVGFVIGKPNQLKFECACRKMKIRPPFYTLSLT